MRTNRIAPVAALALALSAGACGGKEATGPNIGLSLEEVSTLAQELGNVFGAVSPISALVRKGPMAAILGRVTAATLPFNQTAGCPGGGTATVAGTLDTTATAMSANAAFTYTNCRTAHFTTSGSFQASGTYTNAQTTQNVHLTAGGTLSVTALDERSGICIIDLTLDGNQPQAGNPVFGVRGSACGVNVSGTY